MDMSGCISFSILCLILAMRSAAASPAIGSTERVHIRLHMPEIVRQHTHFHKVYKVLSPPPPSSSGSSDHPPAMSSKWLSLGHGKPHVSLLGYTTTASGTGTLAPNVMQILATAATPTLPPNYGPALFDSYNPEEVTSATSQPVPATSKPPTAGGNYLAPASDTSNAAVSSKLQLLQQIFRPNIVAAISQQQSSNPEMELDAEPELEPQVEQNKLLNSNFLAALQNEYLMKFAKAKGKQKRKKAPNGGSYRRPHKPSKHSNYVENLQSEDPYEDFPEESPTGYEDQRTISDGYSDQPDEDTEDAEANRPTTITGFDSAVAFSGQSKGLRPTVDQFLSDERGNSYSPYYSNMYDDYGPSAGTDGSGAAADGASRTLGNWQSMMAPSTPNTYSTYMRATPATPTKLRIRHQSRPTFVEHGSGSGGKVRLVKLTTRKKRKNRIKSKLYRF